MRIPRIVEKPVAQARYDLCKQCPELEKITSRCRKCGCFMKIKVKLDIAECPLGHWAQVELPADK